MSLSLFFIQALHDAASCFPGGGTPYVYIMLHRLQNRCQRSRVSRKTSATIVVDFSAPVKRLPLEPKHLERDMVSNNYYLFKKGSV